MIDSPGPIPAIIAAIQNHDRRAATQLLRQHRLPLAVEYLPEGKVWVIGRYLTGFSGLASGQDPLAEALSRQQWLPSAPRVTVGRWNFWRQAALEFWAAG